jgi:2,4-dichlorophenol 6-monooxygenase
LSRPTRLRSQANIESRKENNPPEGKSSARNCYEAIAFKSFEFNCHGVEMNQRYASRAVVPTARRSRPIGATRSLYYQATTWPGAHLPHVWVEHHGSAKSTLDLTGKGRFTLLTGIGGDGWKTAAAAVTKKYGVALDVVTIGPAGCDALDIYADWYRQSEVDEDGCVLVRPDMYVAWRAKEAMSQSSEACCSVFSAGLLGREAGAAASIAAE